MYPLLTSKWLKQVLMQKHFQYYTVFHFDRIIRYCKMWNGNDSIIDVLDDLKEGKLNVGILQKELLTSVQLYTSKDSLTSIDFCEWFFGDS